MGTVIPSREFIHTVDLTGGGRRRGRPGLTGSGETMAHGLNVCRTSQPADVWSGAGERDQFSLLIELDRAAGTPLSDQVANQLRDLVCSGGLPGGTPLPPSRPLAADMLVSGGVSSPPTTSCGIKGGWSRGRVRAPASPHILPRAWLLRPSAGAGTATCTLRSQTCRLFPRVAWSRAFTAALAQLPTQELGYGWMRGFPSCARSSPPISPGYAGSVCSPTR